MQPKLLQTMADEMRRELISNILPFWPRFADPQNGGFYGSVGNDGSFDSKASKGIVQHSRLLWTYARASIRLADPSLLSASEAAFRFIVDRFYDAARKGFFWTVDYRGVPEDTCKRIYGQAFAVYAFSEYARAGGPPRALELAMETFRLLEKAARDPGHGGYFEAVQPDWSGPAAGALSSIDMSCAKSMNTNLHVMEALTALYEASGDGAVRSALRELIDIHLTRIISAPEHPAAGAAASRAHLGLYFDADWKRLDSIESYGHDIEASWLLTEAASRAWDGPVPQKVKKAVLEIAAGTTLLLKANGGTLPNEMRDGRLEAERIWWVQAETIIGMVNAWQLSADESFLDHALAVWRFIQEHIVDRKGGEWFWGAHSDGRPLEGREKGGLWKAGYHESRLCMEIMERAAHDVGVKG